MGLLWRFATLFAAVAFGCSCPGGEPQEPPPPPVEVAQAGIADVPATLETIGTVESIITVQVRSRVNGQLLSVEFEPGQEVEEGALLFQLDPRPFEHALAAAEATLAEARVQARHAQAERERYRTLARRGAAATQQAEQAEATARAAQSAVEAAQAQVENATLDLGYTTIRAPISGRTGDLLVHVGDQIQANAADPMVTIQVMDPIYVRFTAAADRLAEIRAAQSEGTMDVIARGRSADSPAKAGELTFIDNQVDLQTGTILLKASFPNRDEAFWPGEPMDVSLKLRTLEGVVVVPSEAIQVGQETPHVFVLLDDSTVEMREVREGPQQDGMTAILQGVREGETVVTSGQLRLQPGVRVQVVEPGQQQPGQQEQPDGSEPATPEEREREAPSERPAQQAEPAQPGGREAPAREGEGREEPQPARPERRAPAREGDRPSPAAPIQPPAPGSDPVEHERQAPRGRERRP